jgi:hypothetical protein
MVDPQARNETVAALTTTLVRMRSMVHTLSCLALMVAREHHSQTLRHKDPRSIVKA